MPNGVKLKNKEKSSKNIIESYLKDSEIEGDLYPFKEIDNDSHQLINDFYNLIMMNNLEKDKALGIYSFYVKGDEGLVYLRDARSINDKLSQEEIFSIQNKFNFINWVLTYFIAYVRIVIVYNLPSISKDISDLFEKAKEFIDDYTYLERLEESNGNLYQIAIVVIHRLIDSLYKEFQGLDNDPNNNWVDISEGVEKKLNITREGIEKILDFGNKWVAMEMPTISIATIEEVQGKIFINLETPVCELSEQTKKSLEMDFLKNKKWFKELSEHEKLIVIFYIEKYKKEDRVIPSQLRNKLPFGNKNHYKHTVFVVEGKQETFLLNSLTSYFHSGTVVYVNTKLEDEMITGTVSSLSQQMLGTGCDMYHIMTLNGLFTDYILKFFKLEKSSNLIDQHIVTKTQTAARALEDHGVFASNICLNGERKFVSSSIDNIYKIFIELKIHQEIFDDLIKNLTVSAEAVKEICQEYRFFIGVFEKFLDGWKGLVWKDVVQNSVPQLNLSALLNILCHLNNKIIEALQLLASEDVLVKECLEQVKTIASAFACASGENRTLINGFHSNVFAKYYYLMNHLAEEIVNGNTNLNIEAMLEEHHKSGHYMEAKSDMFINVTENAARTFHFQMMAGFQGGTLGTEGIRDKSAGSIPKYYSELVGILLVGPKGIKKPADQKNIPDLPEALPSPKLSK